MMIIPVLHWDWDHTILQTMNEPLDPILSLERSRIGQSFDSNDYTSLDSHQYPKPTKVGFQGKVGIDCHWWGFFGSTHF